MRDPFGLPGVRPGPGELPGAAQRRTQGGRRLAPLDNGTVALALSGMAFYWLMPALMSRRGRRRRTRRSRGPAA